MKLYYPTDGGNQQHVRLTLLYSLLLPSYSYSYSSSLPPYSLATPPCPSPNSQSNTTPISFLALTTSSLYRPSIVPRLVPRPPAPTLDIDRHPTPHKSISILRPSSTHPSLLVAILLLDLGPASPLWRDRHSSSSSFVLSLHRKSSSQSQTRARLAGWLHRKKGTFTPLSLDRAQSRLESPRAPTHQGVRTLLCRGYLVSRR